MTRPVQRVGVGPPDKRLFTVEEHQLEGHVQILTLNSPNITYARLVIPWLLANIAQYSASSLLQRHEISSRASLQTTIIGSPVTAVHIWNSLHDNEVSVTSLQTFQHNLETFLFQ